MSSLRKDLKELVERSGGSWSKPLCRCRAIGCGRKATHIATKGWEQIPACDEHVIGAAYTDGVRIERLS